ncbi:glycoside hydrolase family 3 N-terminal domain-containing protein [Saccharicrinis sp. FJH54]|uniref:glycoside hydrolase family 3 N-terminal domain-containing protein n=1 Tax=Saccharicrinis sp. FJH54 TaxID=3344665 RepID=UPI0035D40C7C
MLRQIRELTILFLFLFSFQKNNAQQNFPVDPVEKSDPIDSVIASLTLDQKIGQLFFIDVQSAMSENDYQQLKLKIETYEPGGILFMQGTPSRQLNLIHRLNGISEIPLFYSIDGEWGVSMRLDSVTWFPKHMMLGAIRDNRIVKEVGYAVGMQCRNVGININFAPVLDVNSNAENPVINMRSFGENPNRVADKGYAYFSGMQSAGVVAVGKHFPGHGDTNLDSHHDLPIIHKSLNDLSENELIPFRKAINLGIEGIMAGHLLVSALDSTDLPVSLSKQALDYLRNDLQFRGLIFSDALNMRAVDKRFRQHYVKAFLAGNDVLLFPADLGKAVNEIKNAVSEKVISEQEIDDRLRRILQAKRKYIPETVPARYAFEKDNQQFRNTVDKAIRHAVTLVRNEHQMLPLSTDSERSSLIISVGGKFDAFGDMLKHYRKFDQVILDVNNTDQINRTLLKASGYDDIIVAFTGNIFSVSTNYGFYEKVQDILLKLPSQKNISLVLFSNPYLLKGIKNTLLKRFSSVLVAYEDKPEIEKVAAQIVMGGLPAMGMLPVSAGPLFPAGTGLYTSKIRLNYGYPENERLQTDTLNLIDSLVYSAIADKAMPGCQVLIAKNGEVIFDKAYGYQTYKERDTIVWDDLYDLASVTKITATLPVVMHLNEVGKLNLDMKLREFDHLCTDTFKSDISIRELLLHQSGLKPYIPFHYMIIDTDKLKDGLFSRRKTSIFNIQVGEGVYVNRYAKFKDGFVSKKKDADHSVEVVPGMYMFNAIKDSIYTWIDTSDVDSTRSYRYSDLNFYYLEKVVDFVTHTTLDTLADSLFYRSLGMNNTMYKPVSKVELQRIVPTEDDHFFRKRLLRGYVHDQAAAMVGGVSGHAGLFSNATDLAKYGQMLLNDGWYGNRRYFKNATIEYYTQTGNQVNRRGLGFDKPEPDTSKISPACLSASLESFGHSGFTGTYLWIDPKYQIVYVFLSNRVNPDAYNIKLIEENVRTNIQQKIYNAMLP